MSSRALSPFHALLVSCLAAAVLRTLAGCASPENAATTTPSTSANNNETPPAPPDTTASDGSPSIGDDAVTKQGADANDGASGDATTPPINDAGATNTFDAGAACWHPAPAIYRVQAVRTSGKLELCPDIDTLIDLTPDGIADASAKAQALVDASTSGTTCTQLSSDPCVSNSVCVSASAVTNIDQTFDPATGNGTMHMVVDYTNDDAGALMDCTWSITYTKQ